MADVMDAKRIPFSDEDERRIASAATWGIIVAATSIAAGLISLVVSYTAMNRINELLGASQTIFSSMMLIPMVQAGVTILINLWLLQASLAFRKVALTDEADQVYLLQGFRKLRAYFMVQVIMLLLMLGLVFLGVLKAC